MSLTKATYSMIEGAPANVLDFGAVGNGVANDSAAVQAAINTGKAVYFPAGTYLCAVSINNKTILYGDGSTLSKIKPFDVTTPAMIYTFAAVANPAPGAYWSYHSIVRDLGFYGAGINSGNIGFSFGSSGPANYTANAEYANNVTFYNCFFTGLSRAVQFPFGNIGSAFYSCGFQTNYYGIYSINNKSGSGDPMHAGNKYFYNGEFSSNVCAVFIDNGNQIGFGGITFTDTIFEYNNIVLYLNNDSTALNTAVSFKNCWNEGNGITTGLTSVIISLWTGSVETTQVASSAYPWIIKNALTTIDGGLVYGVNLKGSNSRLNVQNSLVETAIGFGGTPCLVDDENSRIYFENCQSFSGFGGSPRAVCKGVNYSLSNDATVLQGANSRLRYLPLSYSSQITGGAFSGSGVSVPFTSAENFVGAASGTSTVVADGIKYANCNSYSFAFTTPTEYIWPTNTQVTLPAGWFAYTFDINVTLGAPVFSIQDLFGTLFGSVTIIADSTWRTVGGVAYNPASATVQLVTGETSFTANWLISAYQIKPFESEAEAQEFIAAQVYMT
mgnify:CR=1 FL=1|tara:strand:- start:47 stop:1714 length:1668 start_codon:yes stop_codon:yes gene_type:complete